ncbi:N-acetylhexosaminidase [Cristinia sonorae]|uniref:Beta-hexosaminidase n=1 Tax=Cristinia sonorae TaxID=1940300 RepID=A0A8K0UGS7_9AGAR|nr:N-acetylhexosaminidase [Cristinia sonorae]
MHLFPLIVVGIFSVSPAVAQWPIPRNITRGNEIVKLDPNFAVLLGNIDASTLPDLNIAKEDTRTRVLRDNLQRLARSADLAVDNQQLQNASTIYNLTLYLNPGTSNLSDISSVVQQPLDTWDESYSLTISGESGQAPSFIVANTTLGLLRGLTTFEQLWYTSNDLIYALDTPINIEDSPAYPYRGFMLDTSRNFIPVQDINRTLAGMSMAKLNVFHWHIVDSQSFPLQLPDGGFADLSEKGAYSIYETYNASEVQEITSYAASLGIQVMVEIDIPGHSAAIAQSHPEHIACNEASPWQSYANEPPAGQLRFAVNDTANFTTALLGQVAKLFPHAMISTGGDEINLDCYANDTQTQEVLASSGQSIDEALKHFLLHTHEVLQMITPRTVVWQDVVLNHSVGLSTNKTLVMVWDGVHGALDATSQGYQIIHAPSDYFYLDCGAGSWVADGSSNDWRSWCDPFKTWQKAYSFNPTANMTPNQAKLVLGGEQLLWTEQTDTNNLDSVIWPRAAVAAEIFWTGDTFPDGSNRTAPENLDGTLARLHALRYRMVQRGLKATPLQPHWCAINPGNCSIVA